MDLIESEQSDVPVEAEPRYVSKTASLPAKKTEHGQTWVRTVAVVFAAIIAIALIVLLARWIYHISRNDTQPAPPTGQQAPAGSSQNGPAGGQASPEAGSSANQPSANAPSTNPQLTNTGPGSVAAIFIGASLAAAGLHFIVSLRRQTNY